MNRNGLEAAVLAATIFIAAAVVLRRMRAARLNALATLAGQRGWVYREYDDKLARQYLGKPFGHGRHARTQHVLTGVHRGREFVAFEYLGTKRGADWVEASHHAMTVVGLSTPADRPTLDVSRHDADSRLFGLVGARYVRLESEQFNDAFVVTCDNDRFAYDVLHPRMMEWLLADQRTRELPFRFEQANLVSCRPGEIEPGTVLWLLNYLSDVLERVPDFVWKP